MGHFVVSTKTYICSVGACDASLADAPPARLLVLLSLVLAPLMQVFIDLYMSIWALRTREAGFGRLGQNALVPVNFPLIRNDFSYADVLNDRLLCPIQGYRGMLDRPILR